MTDDTVDAFGKTWPVWRDDDTRSATRALVEALTEVIHHAEDNEHVITDGQGIAPGERAPAVRIADLRAILDNAATSEVERE